MAEGTHRIQVHVDASSGVSALKSLASQSRETANALRGIGSGAGGFDKLAAQVAASSGAFDRLARSLASLGSASSSIARQSGSPFTGFTNGAHSATSAVTKLTNALNPLHATIGALSAALGGLTIGKFVSDSMKAGTSALNLRIAVDAVATSATESGRALQFIRDSAMSMGAPLDTATKNFTNFYTSARALGKSQSEIEHVFGGFQKAMTGLHVSNRDQSLFFRELAETYSMGKIDATRAIRSMGSHLPGMNALLQESLSVSGAKLHEMFRNGGLPLETWDKAATILEKRYGGAVKEALEHAQGAVISLSSAFELLQQKTFEGGLDSGIAQLANTITTLLKPNIDGLATSLGEAFRAGAASASLFASKLYEFREPLANIATAVAGFVAASAAFRVAAGAVALLLTPLGMLASLVALTQSSWLNLSGVIAGSDAQFRSGSERVKELTFGLIDFERAIRGGIKMWELFKSLAGGSSFGDAQKAAIAAAQAFDAGRYGESGKQAGASYADGFASQLKKIGDAINGVLPGSNLVEEYRRLYEASAPKTFEGHGNYDANAQNYARPHNELGEALKKVYERLLPANKALMEYKEALESIAKMRDKIDPQTGAIFSDSTIQKMRDAARETALKDAFPAASEIAKRMDKVRLEREALANAGGSSREALAMEREFLQIKYDLLRKHVQLRADEEQALRGLIAAEHELAKGGDQDPFTRWANQQKSSQDSLNDSIASGMDSLADGLARAATSGKDLRSTLQGLLREISANFLRQGIRSLMAEGLKSANLGQLFGGGDSAIAKALGLGQGVLDKANGALDKIGEEALKHVATANMDVQAAVVNINGLSTSGIDSFKPAADLSKAIKPESVGGIAPTAVSTQPMFANTLPDFASRVRTDGLGSIPTNSASLFSAGLNPTQVLSALPSFKGGTRVAGESITSSSATMFGQGIEPLKALGAVPDFKGALKSIPESISRNSLAEFGRRINLQRLPAPTETVRSAGLRAPTASEELASSLGRTGGSRSWRNSNPGNIEYTAWARAHGAIGTDGRFAKFPNDAVGTKAQADLLFDSKGYRDLTLKQAIHRWAPASENNVPAYIKAMGADPSMRMRDFSASQRQVLLENMRRHEGWKPGRTTGSLGSQKHGVDATPTGSITKLGDETRKVTEEIKKQIASTRSLTTEAQKSFQGLAQTSGQLTNFDGGVTKLTDSLAQGAPAADGFGDQLAKLIQQMLSGLGGSGGGIGGAVSGILGGLFSEGGYVTEPVSSAVMPQSFWAGAQHFNEGGRPDGIPVLAHADEAVVPLSRGRAIPVDLSGVDMGGGDRTINNAVTINVGPENADSFRRSKSQLAAAMHRELGRMHARNA